MTFPDGFRFGSGASGAALEGTAPAADLALWEHEGRAPGRSGVGAGFAASFRDDLARRADLGLVDLRLTLEWARLEPAEGKRDRQAEEHLRLVLEAARDAGLQVWGCLHDGTLPGWFAHDEHGYADARSRGYYWARHVEYVAEVLGRPRARLGAGLRAVAVGPARVDPGHSTARPHRRRRGLRRRARRRPPGLGGGGAAAAPGRAPGGQRPVGAAAVPRTRRPRVAGRRRSRGHGHRARRHPLGVLAPDARRRHAPGARSPAGGGARRPRRVRRHRHHLPPRRRGARRRGAAPLPADPRRRARRPGAVDRRARPGDPAHRRRVQRPPAPGGRPRPAPRRPRPARPVRPRRAGHRRRRRLRRGRPAAASGGTHRST